jgi:MarR family transcriptional regulator, organic hydroperoxide resistance regulator
MSSLKNIDFPALYSDSLYFSSGALARQIEKVAKEAWKPSGLHPSQAYLLELIADSKLPYPTMFAKGMELSPSTITRMLEKLEKKQLITRAAYTPLSLVTVTDKGWKLWPVLLECKKTFIDRCKKLLGEQEHDRLISAMIDTTDKLVANCLATDGKSGPE